MAKKTPDATPGATGPPKRKKNQVLLDPAIATKIGVITAVCGVSIQDWVNNRLAEIVDRHFEAAMESMGLDVTPKKK